MAPSPWQLLIVLLIVVLLFGTKKLRNIGSDLGSAFKSFRNSMKEGESEGESGPRLENGETRESGDTAESREHTDTDR